MELWVPVLVAGIGSPLLLEAFKTFREWLSGREGKKRTELEKAWSAFDSERKRRRVIEEHAGLLRRRLIEAPCIDAAEIPEWPHTMTGPIATQKEEGS